MHFLSVNSKIPPFLSTNSATSIKILKQLWQNVSFLSFGNWSLHAIHVA